MTDPHGADSAEIERLRQAFEDRIREPYRKEFEAVPWHVLERSETDTRFYRKAETRAEWETFQAGARALAALRTRPDDAVIPAGIVPDEPTDDQILAGVRVWLGKRAVNFSDEWRYRIIRTYRAMLAAAPLVAPDDAVKLREADEAYARSQADHWLDDMATASLGARHVSLMAMAKNCIEHGRAALKGTPNDDA